MLYSQKRRLKNKFKEIMFTTVFIISGSLIFWLYMWLCSVIGVFAYIAAGIIILILWKIENIYSETRDSHLLNQRHT